MSLLSNADYTRSEIEKIIEYTKIIKESPRDFITNLSHKNVALIFEKSSTRTRISFELAVKEMGGNSIVLNSSEMQLGRGENIHDTAKVLERYVDSIMARVINHEMLVGLEENSDIPIINGLSDKEHPCQILTDLFTVSEDFRLSNVDMTYLGDGNNVCNSLMIACSMLEIPLTVGCPKGYAPDMKWIESKVELNDCVKVVHDPVEAIKDKNVVYTDTWISMGDEEEAAKRVSDLKDFQVDSDLMSNASDKAIFMHCLPAHRGEEVTDEVIDSAQSVVFRQAENRLHTQKAILLKEMVKNPKR